MLSDQDASQTGAKAAGLTIRLFGLASVWLAAISSSRNSRSKTVRLSMTRSGLDPSAADLD
jgi:hypothetical protein